MLKVKVIGNSMYPILKNNCEIMVEPKAEYKKGDIIVFWKGLSNITVHRIVWIDKNHWIYTRGDANSFVDLIRVKHEQIIGRVYLRDRNLHIKFINLIQIMKSKMGWSKFFACQANTKKRNMDMRRIGK
ncbi:MAG: signal peptidase I [Clostridiales bacterium]|nr:signal peptidase I [Clostridiales bacterium]